LLIGVVASLVVSVYQGLRHHREREIELHQRFQAIANYITPALVESLWAFNEAQIRAQLEGLSRDQSVSAVVLRQVGLPDQRHGQREVSAHTYERVVPLIHTEDGKVHRLGTLHLVRDLEDDQRQTVRDIAIGSLGNALVTLLVIAIALATYHTFVQRRLAVIVDELGRMGSHDLLHASRTRDIPMGPIHDEIDELAQAIVQLKITGGSALALLDQKTKRCKRLWMS